MTQPRRISGPGGTCSIAGTLDPTTDTCVWIELGRDDECCLNTPEVLERIIWSQ